LFIIIFIFIFLILYCTKTPMLFIISAGIPGEIPGAPEARPERNIGIPGRSAGIPARDSFMTRSTDLSNQCTVQKLHTHRNKNYSGT
jgi:hypothetical protein